MPTAVDVRQKLPIKPPAALPDYVKQTPTVPCGSVGNGSSHHLAGAYFEQIAGVRMTHVPYRVTAQLVTDLVAGEVPLGFQLVPNVIGQIKAGQIRPIAVASSRRLSALPYLPTAAHAGVHRYEPSPRI